MLFRDILNYELFVLSGTPVTVATLVSALLVLVATFVISFLIQRALRRAFAGRGGITFPHVLSRLLHYLIVVVGFVLALDTIGFSLGTLFTAGAVFAVGLGFAMQNIAQNFVSGVILLIERTIKPGDVLEVQNTVVHVMAMGIRTTIARTRDDEELIIPNSVLVQGTVKNYTYQDSIYRLRALVGVVYSSDMRRVRQILESTARGLPFRSHKREPRILMKEFGNSSVDFDVSVWIDNPWEAPMDLSKLHEAIWFAFKDADITIAFPQLDVHFDGDVTRSLTRISASAA